MYQALSPPLKGPGDEGTLHPTMKCESIHVMNLASKIKIDRETIKKLNEGVLFVLSESFDDKVRIVNTDNNPMATKELC